MEYVTYESPYMLAYCTSKMYDQNILRLLRLRRRWRDLGQDQNYCKASCAFHDHLEQNIQSVNVNWGLQQSPCELTIFSLWAGAGPASHK
jgi:hypothetical protein